MKNDERLDRLREAMGSISKMVLAEKLGYLDMQRMRKFYDGEEIPIFVLKHIETLEEMYFERM